MRTYQYYLAGKFLKPFLLSTAFFIFFLLLFQLFRIIRLILDKGVELSIVFELIGHMCITFVPLALPLAILFSGIFVMNKLSEHSEIIAMRSFGISKRQLFAPFMFMGLGLMCLLFVLSNKWIPYSQREFKNIVLSLTSRGMISDIRSGQFFTDIPDVTLFAEEVDPETKEMTHLFISMRDPRNKSEKIIFAKSGLLNKGSGDGVEIPSMTLRKGNITEVKEERETVENIHFDTYSFPLVEEGQFFSPILRDGMLDGRSLWKILEKREEELKALRAEDRPEHELTSIKNALHNGKIEFYTRINNAMLCLLFMILGAALGIKKGRGRSRNAGPVALMILIFYYALFFGGLALSKRGFFPAILVVFLPTLIVMYFTAYFFKKVDWPA